MEDQWGRTIDYLRLSVTDSCNLGCIYCRLPGCSPLLQSTLTDEEIFQVLSCFQELGIRKLKITGGEPLLRPGIGSFLERLLERGWFSSVTLTTNGQYLERYWPVLSHLDSINVSLDSLQEAVDTRGDDQPDDAEEIYISIPEDKWDEFANDFSVQVYNNKADYRKNSLIISAVLALLGGVVTYFISGHALRPIREFSDKIEKVQAQNLADSRIEENQVKELNQLSVSYNRMLERLSDAFEIQRQFTANAAHELRTPLALMQVQLDLYHSNSHPGNDADTVQMIKMVTEQNDRLNKMVKTLLDMSELQTVGRDDEIVLDALVDEVLEDLEPLAEGKNIRLIGKCKDITMVGSDILIYRLVYNLVENAIKYNHSGGQVIVTADRKEKHVYLSVEDTGAGIPEELKERVFEPFFRVDKSRSRELGGVGLGLALVREIVRVHDGSITVKSNPSGGTIFEVVL